MALRNWATFLQFKWRPYSRTRWPTQGVGSFPAREVILVQHRRTRWHLLPRRSRVGLRCCAYVPCVQLTYMHGDLAGPGFGTGSRSGATCFLHVRPSLCHVSSIPATSTPLNSARREPVVSSRGEVEPSQSTCSRSLSGGMYSARVSPLRSRTLSRNTLVVHCVRRRGHRRRDAASVLARLAPARVEAQTVGPRQRPAGRGVTSGALALCLMTALI